MFWNIPDPKPKSLPRQGTHWRKPGETLTWELLEYRKPMEGVSIVVLSGPGNCKGKLRLFLSDFERQFVRA